MVISIAKLSPSSNFSLGLSWLYFQLIQPATQPATHPSGQVSEKQDTAIEPLEKL